MNLDEAPVYKSKSRQRRSVGNYSDSQNWAEQWLPKHLKYKLRLDTDNVPSTKWVKERYVFKIILLSLFVIEM